MTPRRCWVVESSDADYGRVDFLSAMLIAVWVRSEFVAFEARNNWTMLDETLGAVDNVQPRTIAGRRPSPIFLAAVGSSTSAGMTPYAACDLAFAWTENGTMVFVPKDNCSAKAH